MEQSACSGAISVLASQDIKIMFWKPGINYCVDNSLPLVSIKNQFNIIL